MRVAAPRLRNRARRDAYVGTSWGCGVASSSVAATARTPAPPPMSPCPTRRRRPGASATPATGRRRSPECFRHGGLGDEVTQVAAHRLDWLSVGVLNFVRLDATGLHHSAPQRKSNRIDVALHLVGYAPGGPAEGGDDRGEQHTAGPLRSHMLRQDGTRRDSLYYSVLVDEWPSVRDKLLTSAAAKSTA
jgi:hypothetical protein